QGPGDVLGWSLDSSPMTAYGPLVFVTRNGNSTSTSSLSSFRSTLILLPSTKWFTAHLRTPRALRMTSALEAAFSFFRSASNSSKASPEKSNCTLRYFPSVVLGDMSILPIDVSVQERGAPSLPSPNFRSYGKDAHVTE